jgi:hypothetical protein
MASPREPDHFSVNRDSGRTVGDHHPFAPVISYLDPDTEGITTRFGSADLDVLADPALITKLKQLPGWGYKPNGLRNFLDARIAFMLSVSSDNRRLLVEILHSVNGLDKADLSVVEVVSYPGKSPSNFAFTNSPAFLGS